MMASSGFKSIVRNHMTRNKSSTVVMMQTKKSYKEKNIRKDRDGSTSSEDVVLKKCFLRNNGQGCIPSHRKLDKDCPACLFQKILDGSQIGTKPREEERSIIDFCYSQKNIQSVLIRLSSQCLSNKLLQVAKR